jgi:hypothetical protein
VVAGVIGALTLVFLLLRTLFPPHADAPPPPRWLGGVLAVVSGWTSFVAHAGAPPLAFYVLPLKLKPLVVHGHDVGVLRRHQPVEVAALRVAGPDRPRNMPPQPCCCPWRRWACGSA